MLNDKIYYTDGLRPDDINIILKNKEKAKYFYENDLEKQDR